MEKVNLSIHQYFFIYLGIVIFWHQLLKKMKKKINIGIIGKNFGIKVILKSFQKNKDTNIVALSSLRKPKKEDLNNKNISFYSNWKNMIRAKSIDAVAIASPPNVQEKMVHYALKKNKHVFCEKPFTNSLFKAKKLEKILKKKIK